jgi:hypothetical protein
VKNAGKTAEIKTAKVAFCTKNKKGELKTAKRIKVYISVFHVWSYYYHIVVQL